jgi:hypothetical protein
MFRLRSESISWLTNQSQKGRMDGGTSESPRSLCGGSMRNFPMMYGRLKDSLRAWKMDTSGQKTALHGTTFRQLWQAQTLALLRLIYEETHHQTLLEASGYRSPTWCILRALQTIFQANVVVGESTITASPFFEGAGRPSVFLGTSARTKSDPVGEPAPGGPGEVPH